MTVRYFFNMFTFFILTSYLSISCGKGFDKFEKYGPVEFESQEYQSQILSYKNFFGWFKLSLKNSQLSAKIKLIGTPSDKSFLQVLHHKAECPARSDYVKKYSLSKIFDGVSQFGEILLFFDSKINHSLEFLGRFPRMRRSGSFYYSRAADLNSLYPAGLTSQFSETILMIYEFDTLEKELSPVACGKLLKIPSR